MSAHQLSYQQAVALWQALTVAAANYPPSREDGGDCPGYWGIETFRSNHWKGAARQKQVFYPDGPERTITIPGGPKITIRNAYQALSVRRAYFGKNPPKPTSCIRMIDINLQHVLPGLMSGSVQV